MLNEGIGKIWEHLREDMEHGRIRDLIGKYKGHMMENIGECMENMGIYRNGTYQGKI